jgi:hypothetical protein
LVAVKWDVALPRPAWREQIQEVAAAEAKEQEDDDDQGGDDQMVHRVVLDFR